MRGFLRITVFVVAVFASTACAIFVLSTLGNPYNDVTRGWTTLLAGVTGVIGLAAWVGFVLLKPPYRWEPQEDEERAQPTA